jgi:large subunit ribosomal protein L10
MQMAQKQEVVADLSAKLSKAKCLYLTDFTGLDVAAITELRRRLTSAGVEYMVVKNTLARRALSGGPYEGLTEHLAGPNAFALSDEDVVTAAKILTEFARERERPQIRAGAVEGRVVSIEEIRRIADLPPRDQLLAMVAGTMRAPIAGLVYTLSGLLSKFVRTVDAVREDRQARGEPGGPAAKEPAQATAEQPETSGQAESAEQQETAGEPEAAAGEQTQPADGPAEEPAASAGDDSVTE